MSCTAAARDKRNHRLHALCPYFAMFPPAFAKQAILKTTKFGDIVLDPFSGRGTTVLEALLNGRRGIGTDVNPVATVISQAKTDPPTLRQLLKRIEHHKQEFSTSDRCALRDEASQLPEFFRYAFHRDTLLELLFMRRHLAGAIGKADRFIAALCLGHLHGESDRSPNYFSNQMAHTIAMKPAYAVRYWKEHEIEAPERNVFSILELKAKFRFEDGTASDTGVVRQGDARRAYELLREYRGQVSTVVTSPPYLDVTNFEEDQWLRLWFLGGKPHPTYGEVSSDDRHNNSEKYFRFLSDAWRGIAPLLNDSATLTCRIAAKGISANELSDGLWASVRDVWPNASLHHASESELANRQTNAFRPGSAGCGKEYDFQFRLN